MKNQNTKVNQREYYLNPRIQFADENCGQDPYRYKF